MKMDKKAQDIAVRRAQTCELRQDGNAERMKIDCAQVQHFKNLEIFKSLKFFCSSAFHSGRGCAVASHPTLKAFSPSSRVDLPYESTKSCSRLQQAKRAECTPLVSVHFSILLLLTPPTVITTMEHLCHIVCVVETCEVTSHSVFLDSERAHKRGFVLFHTLMTHSVYSASRMSQCLPLVLFLLRSCARGAPKRPNVTCFLVRVQEPLCHPRLDSADALKQRIRFHRSQSCIAEYA